MSQKLEQDADAYKRDLQNLEFHLLDAGHFALEEEVEAIADYIHPLRSLAL